MKNIVKVIIGVGLVLVLLTLSSTLENYTPEKKKAKNKTGTIYTMIVKDFEVVSKEDGNGGVKQTVYIKHDRNTLKAETPLSVSKDDEIKYEYIDESHNKIKIHQVTHFKID